MEVLSVLTILGLVIGSGFVSGREIVTFFTKFGNWSILCSLLSFFVFLLLLKFILNLGGDGLKSVKNSRFFTILNIFLSIIFSSAMFSGVTKLIVFDNKIVSLFLFLLVLILCFLIYKNGLGTLSRLNLFLVPIMIFFLLFGFFSLIKLPLPNFSGTNFQNKSLFYLVFYCILNTTSGSVVIMALGEKLSKKQKTRVALISSLVLSFLLFGANLILLLNPSSFSADMPLLTLFSGGLEIVMKGIVLLGALTSLFSLIFSSSKLLRGLCVDEVLVFFVSVILPLIVSLLGFKLIVSYIYPAASIIGLFILFELYFRKNSNKFKILSKL